MDRQIPLVMGVKHANEFLPLIFIAHEPQMPSLHERLKTKDLSSVFLI